MLMLVTQRLTASALAVGMVLMALSACAGGAMTMSEMVCCVDHHGECPMADMGKSCCGSDQDAGFGMLKAERADDTLASTIHHVPVGHVQSFLTPGLLAGARADFGGLFHDLPQRAPLAHTVLLI
jgi:hypothetical protein